MKIQILMISVCMVLISLCCGFKNSDKLMENETILKAFIDSWDKHDIDRLTGLFADDCVYEVIADGGRFTSKEQIAAYARNTFSGMPDTRIRITGFVVNDSTAVAEWIWTGTNTVGWPGAGIPATNKSLELRGISFMEIENGLIKRNRDYWDWNTFVKGITE